MEFKQRERTVVLKIVYYGPAAGGKTTNLQCLHEGAVSAHRGELVSVNSAQDRTILLDMLPLRTAGFRGFDLRIQVIGVPGQAMYAATRKLLLRGADAIVFVANSAEDRWQETVQSFHEMNRNLKANEIDPLTVPLVFQYNKRDLPRTLPVEAMNANLNARKLDAIPAVTLRGDGVLETFAAALRRTMESLAARSRSLALGAGETVEGWTRDAVLGMFGRESLAQESVPPAPEEENLFEGAGGDLESLIDRIVPSPADEDRTQSRAVKIPLPAHAERMAGQGPDARANETLVESYAKASEELTAALGRSREEGEEARHRTEDLRQTLAASALLASREGRRTAFRAVLRRMARAAGAGRASVLLPSTGGQIEAVVCLGMSEDILLKGPGGPGRVATRFLHDENPAARPSEDLDAADVLGAATPPVGGVVTVPIRGSRDRHGLILLYYPRDSFLPGADVLSHLGSMAGGLALALDGNRAREDEFERLLPQAVVGAATPLGLAGMEAQFGTLWTHLQAVEQGLDTPGGQAGMAGAVAALAGALGVTRSLLSLSLSQVRREPTRLADVVADLGARSESVSLDGTVLADRVLLRLALRALLDLGDASLRVSLDGERALFTVSTAGSDVVRPDALETRLGRALARRVAELHGGALLATSTPTETRFVLAVPSR